VNINEVAIEVGVGIKNFTNSTQQVVANLPHLLAKKTQGKKLLVDYSQNHVVISKNI
jgi:hypothetical protein